MTTAAPSIQVVVAYDCSPSSERALLRAVEVACRAPQHVLHVVTAIDPRDGLSVLPTDEVDYAYAEKVEKVVTEHVLRELATLAKGGRVEFFVHARIGRAVEEILLLCREVGADLVFIGSHGLTGLERLILGSVSERVVREARCPVMVVRPVTYPHVERLNVSVYEHTRKVYNPPLRFSDNDPAANTRPSNWPNGS
jgi:nucleotide-binding universal stress UspA family protein